MRAVLNFFPSVYITLVAKRKQIKFRKRIRNMSFSVNCDELNIFNIFIKYLFYTGSI